MKNSYMCNTEKRSEKVSLLVFHCFALNTKQMLRLFRKTGTGVHYVILRNGKILNLVNENNVAHHAGISSWRQFGENINAKSIGIELQNSLMGNKPYTKAQINSLIKLSEKIITSHEIKPQNIVGHSDIAPFRKPDPGKYFPWEQLAKYGIGIWKEVQTATSKNCLSGDEKIEELLKEIGYNTTDLTAALYAFTTRFMPQKIVAHNDIVQTEAEVFNYWYGKKSDEIETALRDAPKIYPPEALQLHKDSEINARLVQIADAYRKEK